MCGTYPIAVTLGTNPNHTASLKTDVHSNTESGEQ
jgi:hypothetical protein